MKSAEILGWIKIVGVGVLAAAGIAAGLKISEKVKAGAKLADAAAGAAKDLITRDLNPASNENIVYRGVNAATGGDSDRPLGVRLWEWFNPDKVAAEGGAANVAVQGDAIARAQDDFRRAEIEAQNAEATADAAADEQMSTARSNFRLLEIVAQNNPEAAKPAIFYPQFTRK